MKNPLRASVPAAILALCACQGSDGPSGDNVVAKAAGFEFTAESAAEILAPQSQLPNQPQVVNALADLWVQYYLLARATAEDSTLAVVNVDLLVDRRAEGELVAQLRDRVIQVDTSLTDEELRARFESELPGGQVRARHILLTFPEGASDAQADSVRALAESLRSRILGGEDFETLASQFSQDPGSAARGGDLGSFGRNQMVPPFEAAAFALEEGELSDIVESTFGLHLIRVDERIIPSFEDEREQFRAQLLSRMVAEAESTYVADLVEAAEVEPDSGTFDVVRQLASDPEMGLAPRALGRELVRYRDGALTLGDFRLWLLTSNAEVAPQIEAAMDDQISNLLQSLTRNELLVNQAMAEGLEVSDARRDSLAEGLSAGIRDVSQQLGFFDVVPEEGETGEEAADRAVKALLTEIVQGRSQVIPLQTVGFALKEQYGGRVFQPGIQRTLELVDELRLQASQAPETPAQETPPDTTAPDTTGGQG